MIIADTPFSKITILAEPMGSEGRDTSNSHEESSRHGNTKTLRAGNWDTLRRMHELEKAAQDSGESRLKLNKRKGVGTKWGKSLALANHNLELNLHSFGRTLVYMTKNSDDLKDDRCEISSQNQSIYGCVGPIFLCHSFNRKKCWSSEKLQNAIRMRVLPNPRQVGVWNTSYTTQNAVTTAEKSVQ